MMRVTCQKLLVVVFALSVTCGSATTGQVWASVSSPHWKVESFATPTNFSPDHNVVCEEFFERLVFPACDGYVVTITNVGGLVTDGSEITIKDIVPEGLTVRKVDFLISSYEGGSFNVGLKLCTQAPPIECHYPGPLAGEASSNVAPDGTLKMIIYVTVDAGAPAVLDNQASVSGGGAADAATEDSNSMMATDPPFGPRSFELGLNDADGEPDTQAGDHPYELTTTIGLDNAFRAIGPQGDNLSATTSTQDVKDVVIDLPFGLVGSALATPECVLAQLAAEGGCPSGAIVGHIKTEPTGNASANAPIYNLVPEQGVPAEFGFVDALHNAHVLDAHIVPTPSGYVLRTTSSDIPQVNLNHIAVTFYGDPVAKHEEMASQEGQVATPASHIPFFTNPTNCSGEPLVSTVYMDSWQNPGTHNPDGTPSFSDGKWVSATSQLPPVTGCELLQFPAEVYVQPTVHKADQPTGLQFELKVPQSETIGLPGTPTLKKIVTTLPEGLTVNPSAGDGLAACSEAQIGWLGGSHLNFSPDPPQCPDASKIGTLELETPLVAHKFEGEMFLASQNENPFGATLAAYVVVNDPIAGVLVKIPGELIADKSTGQLTAIFDENPNLPFSDLKLHFFGGPRAALATPENCGTYTANVELFPYSMPDSGTPTMRSDSFLIDEACPSGFAPKFTALSTNVKAGAYTPLQASFSRSDEDQELTGLTTTLPPGLLGKIAGIPLCSDAQVQAAKAGTGGCPESSRVGTVDIGVGPGPDPLFVSGKAYLTGPYNGGPYGLAVVVPAIAGPYNFGTVVVRQSLRIDARTIQVTDVSDPFPTIIDGIPVRLRRADLTIDRPEFIFNPTSCAKQSITAAISGSPLGAPRTLQGDIGYATQTSASSPSNTPFQVTDCAALRFAPKFKVSTKARATRLNGASLSLKLTYPKAGWGTQANIQRVKVSLPQALPSRLTTLQKACRAQQFDVNPAGCPAESVIGHATARTPALPDPLTGPVYFVSHGNEAFPNLIMLLQGNNVTVQLVATTFISKKGVTTSTLKSVPDAPVSSFELTLGQGPHSALAANLPSGPSGSFCRHKLKMPTEFVAQNGAVIKQITRIAVTGCPKRKRNAHRASPRHARRVQHAIRRGGIRGG